jgi:hypothetical protein
MRKILFYSKKITVSYLEEAPFPKTTATTGDLIFIGVTAQREDIKHRVLAKSHVIYIL